MLGFLIEQVSSKSFLFFLQLANLEVSLFIEPNKLHVEIANLILLLLTVLLQLSNLQFILLVVAEVDPLDILDLHVILILEFADLHVLHMFDVGDFLLQFLNLVDQLSCLQVVGGGAVDRQ